MPSRNFCLSLLSLLPWLPVNAVEPPWRKPGACLTPKGDPCRTLIYIDYGGWNGNDRSDSRYTEAVRSDGASMLRLFHKALNADSIPSQYFDRARLIFPTKRETFEVEHSVKQWRRLPGLWWFYGGWTFEPDCRKRAESAGQGSRQTGNHPTIGGYKSIEYLYGGAKYGVTQRVAFAPELGCTVVEMTTSITNGFGRITSEAHFRLESATLAEPDGATFAIPKEYAEAPQETYTRGSSTPWHYIPLDSFPGCRGTAFNPEGVSTKFKSDPR